MLDPKKVAPYERCIPPIQKVIDEKTSESPWIEESQLHKILQATPGLTFQPGTTWDQVISGLVRWNYLQKIHHQGKIYYLIK